MESIKSEAISNLFKSTTNLDAFEDFLASLPQFESSDENQEGGTSLPEIGFDGMPSDLLSALREQVSRAREQQSARQAEPEQAPAVISDATTIGEGYKPAVAEPKLVMPKRKVSVVLRKEEAPRRRQKRRFPEKGKKLPSLWTPRTLRKPWTTGIPRIPAHSKKTAHHLQGRGNGNVRFPRPQTSGPPWLRSLPTNPPMSVPCWSMFRTSGDKIFAVHVERPWWIPGIGGCPAGPRRTAGNRRQARSDCGRGGRLRANTNTRASVKCAPPWWKRR